jgi:mycothiol synthase
MFRPNLAGLPELAIPPDCGLRTYQPGDEAHWARIMNDCIGENWTPERALNELVRRPEFSADACFFATINGVPEGSATAWQRTGYADGVGYVHMVGVTPASRGKGLGKLVTLATLHWFRDHGYRSAVLNTDDWRLPAIGVYLALGFEPVLFNDEHTQRWSDVQARIAARSRP